MQSRRRFSRVLGLGTIGLSLGPSVFARQTNPLPAVKNSTPRQIIIDTDAGYDDWLSILFLMKCPGIQILGVTVNGVGESHLQAGMNNVKNLLNFALPAGLKSYPNVYPGATTPLSANYGTMPVTFRERIDTFGGIAIPSGSGGSEISTTTATQYFRRAFDAAAKAGVTVDVLAIGGFTNLATLFKADPPSQLAGSDRRPSYADGIGTIYAMAGAISAAGDVCTPGDSEWSTYCPNDTAEWNVFIDPVAAQTVLNSPGVKTVLVPLDATNHAPITSVFCTRYAQAAQSAKNPYATFVATVLNNSPTPITLESPNFFFDPLTAAVLVTQDQLQKTSSLGLVWTSGQKIQVSTAAGPGVELGAITALTTGPLPPVVQTCAGTSATSAAFNSLFQLTTLMPGAPRNLRITPG